MKRDILICVAGATPQIITETIYALAMKSPPVRIDEMYVITTTVGRELIEEKLINEGVLHRLIREYDLPALKFTPEHIILIRDHSGSPLSDIKTSEDSEATGDLITEVVREFASRPDVVLHCSIAGGRKTMSYYLGAALQLYGRPCDRLYHVLVSPEFEANPEFYYPPKKPRKIRCRLPDGTEMSLSTAQAKVYIAELPYLRLRQWADLGERSFRRLIEETQQDVSLSIRQLPLRIHLSRRRILIGDREIVLQPMPLAIYTLLAEQKTRRCPVKSANCQGCSRCYLSMSDLIGIETLRRIMGLCKVIYRGSICRLDTDRWHQYRKKGGIPPNVILQNLSKIDRALTDALQATESSLYRVDRLRQYGSTTYGLKIDRTRIEIYYENSLHRP